MIEKRLGIRMGDCDAYINVAGGMRINEPALDLGIVAALLSSYKNITFDSSTICFGEVGLVGEFVQSIWQNRECSKLRNLAFVPVFFHRRIRAVWIFQKTC